MSQDKIRCAVIGVGRMGRHHARIYAQAENVDFLGVVDTNADMAQTVTSEWGGEVFTSVGALIDRGVQAVSIATPTIYHREAAREFLSANVACLIEKPLAPNVQEAEAIAANSAASEAVLQVGHIVRYDPLMTAITRIEQDGPLNPRFIEMDRISPMTFRSVDVGVVFDMMIHDLDLLLMLVGSEPEEIQANAVCVLGEAEDVCNARLTFPPGPDGVRCVANVTASRLAMKSERKIRIISEDAYVSADFIKRSGTVVRKTANAEQLADVRKALQAGEDMSNIDYLSLVKVDELKIDESEPLKSQIDDFLSAVRTGSRPAVDVQAGFAAVRTAERIVEVARAAGARMV